MGIPKLGIAARGTGAYGTRFDESRATPPLDAPATLRAPEFSFIICASATPCDTTYN